MKFQYTNLVVFITVIICSYFMDFQVLGFKIPRAVTTNERLDNVQVCQCVPRERQCSIVPDVGNSDEDYSGADEASSLDYVPRRNKTSAGCRIVSKGRAPVIQRMKRPTLRSTRLKPPTHLRNSTRIVNKPLPEDKCEADQKYCCDSNSDDEDMTEVVEPLPGPFPENPRTCGIQTIIPVPNQPVLAYGQAEFGEYPWFAVILNASNGLVGSGALIDNFHVITAAHKVIEFGRGKKLKVRLGEWNTRDQNEPYRMLEAEIENIVMHPNFNSAVLNLHNDVAIIKLMEPIVFNSSRPHIHPVCLPRQNQSFVGQKCWVAGFGKEDFSASKYSSYLKEVDLPVMESNTCQSRLRRTRLGQFFILNKKSFMCAGGEIGKDACTGDGGAPLVCKGSDNRFHLAGLVAFGIGCAEAGVPGVYVNIPSYLTWIQNTINSM